MIPNFFRVGCDGDKTIRRSDLGWSDSSKRDARSDYPETIFRYFVEIVGLNILFYYLEDGQFYTIETEKTPIEVRRIFPNPNWDGKNILVKKADPKRAGFNIDISNFYFLRAFFLSFHAFASNITGVPINTDA